MTSFFQKTILVLGIIFLGIVSFGSSAHAQRMDLVVAPVSSSSISVSYTQALPAGITAGEVFINYDDNSNTLSQQLGPVHVGNSNNNQTGHFSIPGLQPGTIYYFQAELRWTGPVGPENLFSAVEHATTNGQQTTQAPVITSFGLSVTGQTSASAVMEFQLNNPSGEIDFFISDDDVTYTLESTIPAISSDTQKSATFSGLQPGTDYFIKASITIQSPYHLVDTGGPAIITTQGSAPPPPIAGSPDVSGLTLTSPSNTSISAKVAISLGSETTGSLVITIADSPSGAPLQTETVAVTDSDLSVQQAFNGLQDNTNYFIVATLSTTNGIDVTKGSLTTGGGVPPAPINTACEITKVTGNPSGTKSTGFFSDGQKPQVTIVLEGTGCSGKTISVTLKSITSNGVEGSIAPLIDKSVGFDDRNKATLNLTAGESGCTFGSLCEFGLKITDDSQTIKTWSTSNQDLFWNLRYRCDSSCNEKWTLQSILPSQSSDGSIIAIDPAFVDTSCLDNDGNPIEGCYSLLAPLPGLTKITDQTGLGEYLNTLVKVIIGIISLLSVMMIIVGGIQYMSTDSVPGKEQGGKTIRGAVLGLLLALSSFIILNTIDPGLTQLEPDVGGVSFIDEGFMPLPAAQYKALTGQELPSGEKVLELIDEVSTEQNIDQCIVQAIVGIETGGDVTFENVNARIGQDENVPGTPSYRAFKNSEMTYRKVNKGVGNAAPNDNDASFRTTPDITCFAGVERPHPHMCLDWRFSQGIGFMQITFFPPSWSTDDSLYASNPPAWTTRNDFPSRSIGGKTYEPLEMLDPKKNIEAGVRIMKGNISACNNLTEAFQRYNGGECTTASTRVIGYGAAAMSLYNQCKNL